MNKFLGIMIVGVTASCQPAIASNPLDWPCEYLEVAAQAKRDQIMFGRNDAELDRFLSVELEAIDYAIGRKGCD